MKPEKYEAAKGLFKDTKLNVTNEGKRYLEAVAVTNEYRKEYGICDHESSRMGKQIKGTLMQIWKSPYILLFNLKIIPRKFHILNPNNSWVNHP